MLGVRRRLSESFNSSSQGGWLLGWFAPENDPRHTKLVEVLCYDLPEGMVKPSMTGRYLKGESLHIMANSGCRLTNEYVYYDGLRAAVTLASVGSCALVQAGHEHGWTAEKASKGIAIRLPSRSDLLTEEISKLPPLKEPRILIGDADAWAGGNSDGQIMGNAFPENDMRYNKAVLVNWWRLARGNVHFSWEESKAYHQVICLISGQIACMAGAYDKSLSCSEMNGFGDHLVLPPKSVYTLRAYEESLVTVVSWLA